MDWRSCIAPCTQLALAWHHVEGLSDANNDHALLSRHQPSPYSANQELHQSKSPKPNPPRRNPKLECFTVAKTQ